MAGADPRLTPEDVEARLLGGPRRFRRDEVAAAAGVPVEQARRLWRAVGFPNVGGVAVAFTDSDLAALRRVLGLVRDDVLDDDLAVGVTRAMGHTGARLAEWLLDALVEHLVEARSVPPEEAARRAVELLAGRLEDVEALLLFAWRRQLAAVAGRALASAERDAESGRLSVGFADLVSYTRLSQRLEERELGSLVERFGGLSAEVIAAARGRLVKMVGDEVLFVTDSPADAARIGIELAEVMGQDPVLPDVRVGIATGTVLTRLGDVFGPTVNLASRLTALAAPCSVLVDGETAAGLAGVAGLVVETGRPRVVRGLGLVRPGVVRRTR